MFDKLCSWLVTPELATAFEQAVAEETTRLGEIAALKVDLAEARQAAAERAAPPPDPAVAYARSVAELATRLGDPDLVHQAHEHLVGHVPEGRAHAFERGDARDQDRGLPDDRVDQDLRVHGPAGRCRTATIPRFSATWRCVASCSVDRGAIPSALHNCTAQG